jgi:hypothetical protein
MYRRDSRPQRWYLVPVEPGAIPVPKRWNTVIILILALLVFAVLVAGILQPSELDISAADAHPAAAHPLR